MKPESKKNRGKAGASSVVDTQNNGVESCYDLSNLSNALAVIAPPAIVNPTESSTISATRKDGGSSSSAYDFGDFSMELSAIEHKEKKIAALRARSHRKREYLRMRHVFLDDILCPSTPVPRAMSAADDAAIRPSRRLIHHPLVDFPVVANWTRALHEGFSKLSVEQPVVEEVAEDGSRVLNPTTARPTPQLEERSFPIMYRLSRIVSLGRRRRHCRNCYSIELCSRPPQWNLSATWEVNLNKGKMGQSFPVSYLIAANVISADRAKSTSRWPKIFALKLQEEDSSQVFRRAAFETERREQVDCISQELQDTKVVI
ncbi:unnamed protein product [Linum tenue]|uniref:Uncharacterized protein n=1 Tax=Linum tenue TaxID=586396 RepID=A0AAV0QCJ6_9ROSI|nr:unnamed protein product [Linum tenue]